MAITPYAERLITLVIRLGTGSFGGGGSNQVTLGPIGGQAYSNLRCSAIIQQAPMPHPGSAVITVYGLTLSQINQLTVAGTLYDGRSNTITVQAGDATAGMTTIYTGTIWQAYPKASQPDMAFVMLTNPANSMQLTPAQPVSFKGPIAGPTALSQILKPTGFNLENNGVTAVLSNPYHAGSAWDQIKQITQAMGCYGFLDSVKNVYAIWPKTGARSGGSPGTISAATGMIDYPEFQQAQIKLRMLYDPTLTLTPGNKVQVQSQFAAATGMWTLTGDIVTNISSQMPNGPWEISLVGTRVPGQSTT